MIVLKMQWQGRKGCANEFDGIKNKKQRIKGSRPPASGSDKLSDVQVHRIWNFFIRFANTVSNCILRKQAPLSDRLKKPPKPWIIFIGRAVSDHWQNL